MQISERVKEKTFENVTIKAAYLEACKWISTNIIAVNNGENITYSISKVRNKSGRNLIKVVIYITADEKEIADRNCDICKECGRSFYMAENKYRCEVCKMQPYRKRLSDRLKALQEGTSVL